MAFRNINDDPIKIISIVNINFLFTYRQLDIETIGKGHFYEHDIYYFKSIKKPHLLKLRNSIIMKGEKNNPKDSINYLIFTKILK